MEAAYCRHLFPGISVRISCRRKFRPCPVVRNIRLSTLSASAIRGFHCTERYSREKVSAISGFHCNISSSRKVREDTQHASESWTSQLSKEKKILKIGAWVTELFHFCAVTPILPQHTRFSVITPKLISRVLEKIERIHNMPRKAEHLSFQGDKRFWKSEHGLRSYFIFCAVTPILSVRRHFSVITPMLLNQFQKFFFPLKA